jgi:hypothetical protein
MVNAWLRFVSRESEAVVQMISLVLFFLQSALCQTLPDYA